MSRGAPVGAAATTDRAGRVMLASILTTVSSVYPAFLAGALGPELRASVGLSDRFFGFVIGGFFFGSSVGSIALGRLGERVGARRMIVVSSLSTAATTAVIAAFVRSGPGLVAALALAGLANSSGQTAANKLLSQAIDPARLGFAMAVKQSGMPAATLLGGLAVPAIALTVGWPWAYAAASLLALIALFAGLAYAPDLEAVGPVPAAGPGLVSSRRTLAVAAVAAGFSSAAAGTIGNWTTNSAADAGWSAGAAGLLLAAGSVSGIASRLLLGHHADRSTRLPMGTAATFLAVGALGVLSLAPRSVWLHAVAVVVAFGAGWAWPALFNYAVVRTNRGSAALATGVTQTGVYVGVFTGPIAMGLMVETWGYEVGWTVVATSMVVGATIMRRLAPRF